MSPTLIVVNARVSTGDSRRPWATALAVEEKKLAAIGSSAEIVKMARPTTRVVDAGGQVIAIPPGVSVGSAVHVVAPEIPGGGDVAIYSVEDRV